MLEHWSSQPPFPSAHSSTSVEEDTGERRGDPSHGPPQAPDLRGPKRTRTSRDGQTSPLQTDPTRGGHPTCPPRSQGGTRTWVPPRKSSLPAAFGGRWFREGHAEAAWPRRGSCSPRQERHLLSWVLTRTASARVLVLQSVSQGIKPPPATALRPGKDPHSCPQTRITAPHTPGPRTLWSHSCQRERDMNRATVEEQSPQPPSTPVPPAAYPRSERGPILLLTSQGQRLSSPGVVGNVTQRQAQTTQRPQSATGHKWSGASAAHRLLLLEAPALPGHTGSSRSPRASELR